MKEHYNLDLKIVQFYSIQNFNKLSSKIYESKRKINRLKKLNLYFRTSVVRNANGYTVIYFKFLKEIINCMKILHVNKFCITSTISKELLYLYFRLLSNFHSI